MKSFVRLVILPLIAASLMGITATAAHAQDREVPYWATLRFDTVNMRVGPSQDYPITWVYRRRGLPVRVVRLREGWRLVEDHDGERGWIAASQLNPRLGVLVVGEGLVNLRDQPAPNSALRWRAEPGVVGDLLRCRDGFCEIDVAGRTGWVQQRRLWGAGDPKTASPQEQRATSKG